MNIVNLQDQENLVQGLLLLQLKGKSAFAGFE
jgi:hypothetical protein